jgi:hypothetical protein
LRRFATSAGDSRSASEVKPRTSTNSTEISQSSPPGGASSYQRVHRLGFLREGLMCTRLNGMENSPRKGTRHSLQRLVDGSRRYNLRVTLIVPNI